MTMSPDLRGRILVFFFRGDTINFREEDKQIDESPPPPPKIRPCRPGSEDDTHLLTSAITLFNLRT